MVQTLAILFNFVDNSLSVVRVFTLLDQLDTPVRNVALTLVHRTKGDLLYVNGQTKEKLLKFCFFLSLFPEEKKDLEILGW